MIVFLEELLRNLFLRSFILNFVPKTFEERLLILIVELVENFMFLILKALAKLSFQFIALDIVENVVKIFYLQDLYSFTYVFIGINLVKLEWFLHSPSMSCLVLNFFDYTSFAYLGPFKEVLEILCLVVLNGHWTLCFPFLSLLF